MRHRRKLFDPSGKIDEINVSPLIDIVFILLIFFIVTTVFVEETGVEIQRPRAASAMDLERNSILIAITAEGKVVYSSREIGVNGVRGIVQRLLRQNSEMPVIIQCDRNAPAGVLLQVRDLCYLAGAVKVSVATKRG